MPCIDRPRVPVFQNALYPTAADARVAMTGRLVIRICRQCGFGFNAAFESALVAYGVNYENDQTVSAVFAEHIDRMAEIVMRRISGTTRGTVLEVGCGQGYFLKRLNAIADPPLAAALGFDPAWRSTSTNPPLKIQARLFDGAAAAEIDGPIDAIVTRHVIEHVEDPLAFLKAIRSAVPHGTDITLFVETPCVAWILQGRVVQDFFYEHCSYFTAETLTLCLRRAGFIVDRVDHVFGGQYLWAEARPDWNATVSTTLPDPTHTVELAQRFHAASGIAATEWRKLLLDWLRAGKVSLWGGAAKGVTFASIIDPDRMLIDCLIDVNPRKQGAYVPVTAHPIISPDSAVARGVRTAIIMNPNYRPEIAKQVAAEHLPIELLDG